MTGNNKTKKKSRYQKGQGDDYLSPRERQLIHDQQKPAPVRRPTDSDHDKGYLGTRKVTEGEKKEGE